MYPNLVDIFIPGGMFSSSFDVGILVTENGNLEYTGKPTSDNVFHITKKSYQEISKLTHKETREFISFVPEEHVQAFASLGIDRDMVPWDNVLPGSEFKKASSAFARHVQAMTADKAFGYYRDYFCAENIVFDSLHPAKINEAKLDHYTSGANDAQGSLLETFRPSKGGFSPRPVYDRFKTVTGRLSVSEGPRILTLKKEYRGVLESRFEKDGRILYLDFKSLEPRTTLAANNKLFGVDHGSNEYDIYEVFMRKFEKSPIPRDLFKVAVLSKLYGAGDTMIEEKLKSLSDNDIQQTIDLVKTHFMIDELTDYLQDMASKNSGYIYNAYGRKIKVDSVSPSVLLNYYIQSTAVDVALLGFKSIVENIDRDLVVPLFVLHDALVVDVHKDAKQSLTNAVAKATKMPLMEGTKFFVDISLV